MMSEKSRQQLDKEEPILTFSQLMAEKAAKKQISGVDLYNDIIQSSGKTRKSVNTKYGLEG